MKEKYMELLKNLGLFFIAGFLPNALAFFMVPLYTRCLSTAGYGTVDLLINTVQFLMPLLTIQIQDAVLRYAMDKSCDKREVFSIGMHIVGGGFFLLCIVCTGLQLTGMIKLAGGYLFFFLLNYLAGALNNVFSFFCRAIDRVKILTVGSVLNMLLVVICNLLFLLKFQWGVYGYLAANSIGMLTETFYIIWKAKLYRYFEPKVRNKTLCKEMLHFSAPLILSALSWWVNNASDKYIVTFFCGVSAVGVYSVAYKIPTILKVFSDVIAKAFSISAIKGFDPGDKDGFMGKSYSMFSFVMTVVCSLLILSNVFLAKILFAGEFFEAWRYVPPLLLSILMNQLSMSCESIFVAAKQTKTISWTAAAGAIINTAANFLLIPKFGPYGAAVATAIGFVCFWGLRYNRLTKIVHLKNNFKQEVFSYLLLTAQAAVAYQGNRFWYIQVLILCLILILYRKFLGEVFSMLKGLWTKHF